MGNLGPYQDIVTQAKRLGGVEKMIENIEKAAVARDFPKVFAAGAAVASLGIAGRAAIAKRLSKGAGAREDEANRAKSGLASVVDEASAGQDSMSDDKPDDEDEGPDSDGPEGQA